MRRKKILVLVTCALLVAGLIGVSTIFLRSLNPSEKAVAALQVDVSEMRPGDLRDFGMFSVYRRTAKDFESYVKVRALYADEGMALSMQPIAAQNELRSENPEYFIFYPIVPVRRCMVKLAASPKEVTYHPDQKAINSYPHFFDLCEGRLFDTTGRVLSRNGYPEERNLQVPEVEWLGETIVSRVY